jgi:hypothetical protein
MKKLFKEAGERIDIKKEVKDEFSKECWRRF